MGTLLSLFALFGLPWWAGAGSLAVRRPTSRERAWWLAIDQGWGLVTLAVLPVADARPHAVVCAGDLLRQGVLKRVQRADGTRRATFAVSALEADREPTLITRPPSERCGRASWQQTKTPFRSTSITSSHISSVISSKSPVLLMPALFTSTSMRP